MSYAYHLLSLVAPQEQIPKEGEAATEMVQLVKVLTAKHGSQSSIPGTHMVAEYQLLQVVL